MKLKILTVLVFICGVNFLSAQEVKKFLYKGSIGKLPVTLYLKEQVDGCPTTFYSGMYKYDNVSKWLFLEISDDEGEKLVMVEDGITGILSVKKGAAGLEGFWISPDGSKKLDVKLKEIPTTNKTMEAYEQKFEEVNYLLNDC